MFGIKIKKPKITIGKPKIKVGVPKGLSKAVQGTVKAAGGLASGLAKNAGDIGSSLIKGDVKGLGSSALGLTNVGADFLKDAGKAQLGLATGSVGDLGSLFGSKDLKSLSSNVDKEGNKGIDQYGNAAIDMGANAATLGGYGAAKSLASNLSSGGLGGLFDPKALTGMATDYAASQLGVDPNMAKGLTSALSGDLKGAALQQLGSYAGLDPNQMKMASSLVGGANPLDVASQYGRSVVNDSANAYVQDAANTALDRSPAAQAAYSVAKGDTLSAIAKKSGLSVEQLMAANPNIKDANKIAAGMNINIPSSVKAGVKTAEEIASNKAASDAAEIARAKASQDPSMLSQIGTGISNVVGGVKDALLNNPTATSAGINLAGAGAGYLAGESARNEQQKILDKQIADLKGISEVDKFKFGEDRAKAFAGQEQFLSDRIAGGGMTAKEREMRSEGDLRAARAGAAARMSGAEQQARMGQGAATGGDALAASLAGAQQVANTQSESGRAMATSAEQNLEKAYADRTTLSSDKAKAELDLAQTQDSTGLARAQQIDNQRDDQRKMLEARGNALAGLAGTASDAAVGVVQQAAKDKEAANLKAKQDQAKALQDAESAKIKAQQEAQIKVNAAKVVANKPQVAPPPPAPKSAADTFNGNLANVPGAGVLINSAQQAKVDLENKAKAAAEAAKKTVAGVIPSGLGNIFGSK